VRDIILLLALVLSVSAYSLKLNEVRATVSDLNKSLHFTMKQLDDCEAEQEEQRGNVYW
jgi:lipopolysaccharide export system protein LptC